MLSRSKKDEQRISHSTYAYNIVTSLPKLKLKQIKRYAGKQPGDKL